MPVFRVFDAAVAKRAAARSIRWLEVLAGEKAFQKTNASSSATLDAFGRTSWVSKGPAHDAGCWWHPVLNVALRQTHLVCQPGRCGTSAAWKPLKPGPREHGDFSENTEDIYAGIEFQEGTGVEQFKKLFAEAFPKL